jgi:hypothetical protein
LPKSLPKRIRFTELAISRLRAPPTGEVIYWDSTTPTFGCRVSHTGRKTWTRGKRRLGHYPKMSLKEARARMAGDAPAATTFRELVDGFLEHGRTKRGRPLRQNTIEQYRRLLHGHAKPLHPRRVREIVRADIAALTRKVANENGVAMASLVKLRSDGSGPMPSRWARRTAVRWSAALVTASGSAPAPCRTWS